MMRVQHFIEPLDVLFLRGNKLFGDPGSFGESLVPPRPSVAAGALRSALLAHKATDLARFAAGEVDDAELGTPHRPGSFTLTAFHLARRHEDGGVEPLQALPADLAVTRRDEGGLQVRRLTPIAASEGVLCSSATRKLAVLGDPERGKTVSGFWLSAEGWAAHLAGEPVDPQRHLMASDALWRLDPRVGVGLDSAQRKAAEGKLFTVEAVAFHKREHGCSYDVGFFTEVAGAKLPDTLPLRLGGDGRGALATHQAVAVPEPDYEAIAEAGRCRLILTSPGLFAGGWLPNGVTERDEDGRYHLALCGVRARLVCAAVPRAETVSGWDLAAWSQGRGGPKPAQRVAPAGSVYWLEELKAAPDDLRKLADRGLWSEPEDNPVRRAEGFNRFTFAAS